MFSPANRANHGTHQTRAPVHLMLLAALSLGSLNLGPVAASDKYERYYVTKNSILSMVSYPSAHLFAFSSTGEYVFFDLGGLKVLDRGKLPDGVIILDSILLQNRIIGLTSSNTIVALTIESGDKFPTLSSDVLKLATDAIALRQNGDQAVIVTRTHIYE